MKMKNLFKAAALLIAGVMTCAVLTACGSNSDSSSAAKSEEKDGGKEFIITLYANEAPLTCENFEKLVKEGFYDGLTFHRVIDGFMAQGGDPKGDGKGGSSETIKGEFSLNGVENGLSHTRGVVSMARSQEYDSASSQFFICYSDDDVFLDGQYAAFGKVDEEGMKVVDDFLKIERVTGSDGEQSKPVTPITIEKAEMIGDDADGNHRVRFTMDF